MLVRRPGAWRGGLGRQEQGGILAEDGAFERLQLRAGIEAQLLAEHLAGRLEGPQGLRLPARAVERQHQVAVESLAQRCLAHERLELRDQLGISPVSQLGVDAVLEHRPPELVEPGRLPPEQPLVIRAVEGRSPPERQGTAQHLDRDLDVSLHQRLSAPRRLELEATGVDLVVGHVEAVPAGGRDERVAQRAEAPAQLRHERLQGVGAAGRQVIAPELIGQALSLDRLACPHEEEEQQGALLRAPDGQIDVAIDDLELAEHPERHNRTLRPPGRQNLGFRQVSAGSGRRQPRGPRWEHDLHRHPRPPAGAQPDPLRPPPSARSPRDASCSRSRTSPWVTSCSTTSGPSSSSRASCRSPAGPPDRCTSSARCRTGGPRPAPSGSASTPAAPSTRSWRHSSAAPSPSFDQGGCRWPSSALGGGCVIGGAQPQWAGKMNRSTNATPSTARARPATTSEVQWTPSQTRLTATSDGEGPHPDRHGPPEHSPARVQGDDQREHAPARGRGQRVTARERVAASRARGGRRRAVPGHELLQPGLGERPARPPR